MQHAITPITADLWLRIQISIMSIDLYNPELQHTCTILLENRGNEHSKRVCATLYTTLQYLSLFAIVIFNVNFISEESKQLYVVEISYGTF